MRQPQSRSGVASCAVSYGGRFWRSTFQVPSRQCEASPRPARRVPSPMEDCSGDDSHNSPVAALHRDPVATDPGPSGSAPGGRQRRGAAIWPPRHPPPGQGCPQRLPSSPSTSESAIGPVAGSEPDAAHRPRASARRHQCPAAAGRLLIRAHRKAHPLGLVDFGRSIRPLTWGSRRW